MKKTTMIHVRVNEADKAEFEKYCKENATTPSQLIRHWIQNKIK